MKTIMVNRGRLDLLETLPKQSICSEVGVFRGDYSAEILKRTNPRTLYLVDIFDGVMHSGDRNGENVYAIDMGRELEKVRERFQDSPQVIPVKACSWEWLELMPPATLDWLYLDTSHNYSETLKELSGAWDTVRPGGFICGHDYNWQFPGVIRAVTELCNRYDLTLEIFNADTLASFKILRQEGVRLD